MKDKRPEERKTTRRKIRNECVKESEKLERKKGSKKGNMAGNKKVRQLKTHLRPVSQAVSGFTWLRVNIAGPHICLLPP